MKLNKKIFGIIPITMCQDGRLTLNDLRVFAALSSFQGLKNNCFPSLKKLSERSGVHPSHLSKHTTHLEELGYIAKIRRGKRISNVYIIVDNYIMSDKTTKDDYAKPAKSDYTKRAESDYAQIADSNNKTTIKTTNKTTYAKYENCESEYSCNTKDMLEEFNPEQTENSIERYPSNGTINPRRSKEPKLIGNILKEMKLST